MIYCLIVYAITASFAIVVLATELKLRNNNNRNLAKMVEENRKSAEFHKTQRDEAWARCWEVQNSKTNFKQQLIELLDKIQ